ncbi:hypothetical protein EXU30_00530 [Shewanella maritima]|uniref:SH3b domain-containing protein n=1 Tax=Shewanella maritima TaxID=2520507 RepID=A0A411PCR5_9GAMM|nr:SH3 domain-containing protein [Shewanella maritima]QBF81349.1 hypothetical protein EXU30_00530 [Shewanella maritima]
MRTTIINNFMPSKYVSVNTRLLVASLLVSTLFATGSIASAPAYANNDSQNINLAPKATKATQRTEQENDRIQVTIQVPFIELHSGPSKGYPVEHVIEQGDQVEVILKRTSWYKVKTRSGLEGWFHEDALQSLAHQGETVAIAPKMYPFAERDSEFGIMYGDLEGANYLGVYADYAFSDVFSAELTFAKAFGQNSDSTLYTGMLLAHPFPNWYVVPYLGVGGGYIQIEPHSIIADAHDRQHTLMTSALGVKYPFTRNFIIRAEYNLSLALTDRDVNEEIETWKIGFSVYF